MYAFYRSSAPAGTAAAAAATGALTKPRSLAADIIIGYQSPTHTHTHRYD